MSKLVSILIDTSFKDHLKSVGVNVLLLNNHYQLGQIVISGTSNKLIEMCKNIFGMMMRRVIGRLSNSIQRP